MQRTKEQLLSVLSLLVRHLRSPRYVCYMYAATTIERILLIKRGSPSLCVTQLLEVNFSEHFNSFNQEDIRKIAPEIINTLLLMIEVGGTQRKIAENDYLIKCKLTIILKSYLVNLICGHF